MRCALLMLSGGSGLLVVLRPTDRIRERRVDLYSLRTGENNTTRNFKTLYNFVRGRRLEIDPLTVSLGLHRDLNDVSWFVGLPTVCGCRRRFSSLCRFRIQMSRNSFSVPCSVVSCYNTFEAEPTEFRNVVVSHTSLINPKNEETWLI